jgi:hypothetical protein
MGRIVGVDHGVALVGVSTRLVPSASTRRNGSAGVFNKREQ